jgi:hypothetical protein
MIIPDLEIPDPPALVTLRRELAALDALLLTAEEHGAVIDPSITKARDEIAGQVTLISGTFENARQRVRDIIASYRWQVVDILHRHSADAAFAGDERFARNGNPKTFDDFGLVADAIRSRARGVPRPKRL